MHFVYRARSGNSKHLASNNGELHLLRSSEDPTEAASSVWITNSDRTVRIQHKVPVWEQIIPYTLHGKPCSVIINQGTGLLFYAPDPSLEHGTQVPTTWVEYTFKTVEDCHGFQERLAGQKLLLAADVANISRNKALGSGELLCGREQIRIWKDPHSGTVSVMVRLAVNKGWRKYLVFECTCSLSFILGYEKMANQRGT